MIFLIGMSLLEFICLDYFYLCVGRDGYLPLGLCWVLEFICLDYSLFVFSRCWLFDFDGFWWILEIICLDVLYLCVSYDGCLTLMALG